MKPLSKKLLFIGLTVLSLGLIAYFYINNIFLPQTVKKLAVEKLESRLGRDVSVGKIHLDLLKGVTIRDIRVGSTENENVPFLKVDDLSFKIVIPVLLTEKRLLIPSIHINGAFARVTRNSDRTWNFSDILAGTDAPREETSDLYLTKIAISDSQIELRDKTRGELFLRSIEDIHAVVKLTLDRKVDFRAGASVPRSRSTVKVEGRYDLSNKNVSGSTYLENLDIVSYLPFFPFSFTQKIRSVFIKQTDMDFSRALNKWKFTGDFRLTDALLDLTENSVFKGHITATNAIVTSGKDSFGFQGNFKTSTSEWTWDGDKFLKGDFSAQIKDLNFQEGQLTGEGNLIIDETQMQLGEDTKLNGTLALSNLMLFKKENSLKIKGDGVFKRADIHLPDGISIVGDLTAKNFSLEKAGEDWSAIGKMSARDFRLTLKNGTAFSGHLASEKTTFAFTPASLLFSTTAQTRDATAVFDETKQLTGNPEVHFNLALNREQDTAAYDGWVFLSDGRFEGVPVVENIDDIYGKMYFQKDLLTTDQMTALTGQTKFSVKGRLENLTALKADAQLTTDHIDLKLIEPLITKRFPDAGIRLTGTAKAQMDYTGLLTDPEKAQMTVAATVKQAAIAAAKLPSPVRDVSGRVVYENNRLAWKDLTVVYKDIAYRLSGELKDFAAPQISTSLVSDDIELTTTLLAEDKTWAVEKLTGRYYGSSFNVKGLLRPEEKNIADVNIMGSLSLDVLDIKRLAPKIAKTVEKLKLQGNVIVDGSLKGPLKKWQAWDTSLNFKSKHMELAGYSLYEVSGVYRQTERKIPAFDIFAEIYGGNLEILSQGDIDGDDINIQSQIEIKNLSLAALRKDKLRRNNNLSGNLSLFTELAGPVNAPEELKGRGHLDISEGNIWQFRILQGLMGSLLIPEFHNIVFTDADADFFIDKKKIASQNVTLKSPQVTLKAEGWLDFDQKLNFVVTPKISEIELIKSESLKKGPTQLLSRAVNVKLTGTLEKPQYDVQAQPMNVIRDTTDLIREGVGGILEEIF